MHHASIRTADIHRAIAFYELLGFEIAERFTAGTTLACWLEGPGGRLELLQVPQPAPPPDPFGDESYVGYYHLSFDLDDWWRAEADRAGKPDPVAQTLPDWLASLSARFAAAARESDGAIAPLKILLPPCQQAIGATVYEVAFLADADGMPLEFLRAIARLPGA